MNGKEPEKTAPSMIPYISTTMRDGYSVPMRQALFTAALSGGGAFTAVLLLAWFEVPIPDPLKYAVGAFCVVFFPVALITWLRARAHWMYIIETAMLQDLNQDGVPDIEQLPAVNKDPLPVMIHKQNEREMYGARVDLPHREYLPSLADGLLSGKKFSQREWPAIPQGKFFDIQRAFIEGDLARPNNGRDGANGYSLTREGVETCKMILAQAQMEVNATAPLPYFRSA